MKGIITIALALAISLSAIAGGHQPYFERWCDQIIYDLNAALQSGRESGKFEEEKEILLVSIDDALRTATDKHEHYFIERLNTVLNDYKLHKDIRRQVQTLRIGIHRAITDFHYYDTHGRGQSGFDNGSYVRQLAAQTLQDGMRAPEDHQELWILKSGLKHIAELLDDSDYRRSSDYACARRTVENAKAQVNNTKLSVQGKLIVARAALRQVRDSLFSAERCPWGM